MGRARALGDESKDVSTKNKKKKNVHLVEAYWCNNNFVGVENATQRRSAWMTDLLPESPLYKIIRSAWRDTEQYVRPIVSGKKLGTPIWYWYRISRLICTGLSGLQMGEEGGVEGGVPCLSTGCECANTGAATNGVHCVGI